MWSSSSLQAPIVYGLLRLMVLASVYDLLRLMVLASGAVSSAAVSGEGAITAP